MTISEILTRMVDFYAGNLHDINHTLKVYAWAKTIGEREGLDGGAQETLEIASIVHDIACPLCREKYGGTNGKRQEEEGPALVRAFLADAALPPQRLERVAYLVGHHHTPEGADGPDYQILLEADYLVNAGEGRYPMENIRGALDRLFRTETGRALLRSAYLGGA